ncbi:MAG: crotonase/enoyl-CoA hydratase family protein [Gammaproteobacteria bacterium]|nr:crotonase/enoyl-CoA hydratase family protein [Gammaproteobacteria bacterium]
MTEQMQTNASVHSLFQQLAVDFDPALGAIWLDMQSRPRPCFTPQLLEELRKYQRKLENLRGRFQHDGALHDVHYQVLTSSVPGVFNLGGDLDRFLGWIRNRDRGALATYGRACIDVLYPNAVNYHLPITTIALVRGQALGGGFEAALSSSVIIAESGAQLGLPEILFNLFPGMGAYNLLCRRITPHQAEQLILSGRIYSAEEMHELGIVDVVAEEGAGADAVATFIRRHRRQRNGQVALQRARQRAHRISYQELIDITDIWVDAALSLSDKDMRVIERLVRAQNRASSPDAGARIAIGA